MALSTKLELRHSHQLVMTPQLQQAIRLLQLSNAELTQFVEAEIERNPLLERDETGDSAPRNEAETAGPSLDAAKEEPLGDAWRDLARPMEEQPRSLDAEYDNVFPDAAANPAGETWASARRGTQSEEGERANLEAFVPAETSLKEHLDQQLALAIANPAERMIGQCLVDMVDEAGYLTADLAAVAAMLGASADRVEKVHGVLTAFDPPGVFARSLPECLALQLKDKNRYDPLMAGLLAHLDLLAAHDLAALRKILAVDMDDLTEMIGEIKQLDPKPGSRYGAEPTRAIVPDVIVRRGARETWLVELNTETLPRVLVNRSFCAKVSRDLRSEQDKGYMQNCLQTANWLARSLDQRARTILRVAEEIVRQQQAFLTHGVHHLRPLNLRTVADAISMHESTVSRVTSNKYMMTPRGIFELKYFFTSAINGADGGAPHSSEAVRRRIRELIGEETPRAVLSDDKIVEMLKNSGVDIARRTVAKYREAMRIPSSVQRRRAKRLAKPCG